jgi:hypothetical protein
VRVAQHESFQSRCPLPKSKVGRVWPMVMRMSLNREILEQWQVFENVQAGVIVEHDLPKGRGWDRQCLMKSLFDPHRGQLPVPGWMTKADSLSWV